MGDRDVGTLEHANSAPGCCACFGSGHAKGSRPTSAMNSPRRARKPTLTGIRNIRKRLRQPVISECGRIYLSGARRRPSCPEQPRATTTLNNHTDCAFDDHGSAMNPVFATLQFLNAMMQVQAGLATCRTPLDLWREQFRMHFDFVNIRASIGLGRPIPFHLQCHNCLVLVSAGAGAAAHDRWPGRSGRSRATFPSM